MSNGGYAVGWLTLAFINSAIAQSKNRGGVLWWFLSLLFGPIATAILAIIPAETKPVPATAVTHEGSSGAAPAG